MEKIDLNKYATFVNGVTSEPSKNFDVFIARLHELNNAGVDVSRLITGSIGLAGEAGELAEIVKKVLFHGKEYNADISTHLKKELGDIIWYWTQTSMALGIDPNEVIAENVRKLEARYPGGEFNPHFSENRKDGDV